MTTQYPQVTLIYQNHHIDSTRWEHYSPRDDDIIISTAYKSGTTWMQMIMKQLIDPYESWTTFKAFSPWLDKRFQPIENVIAHLETQTHRRFIKAHLALDGLPYYPHLKYLVLGRDPRDVFMSLWHHYGGVKDDSLLKKRLRRITKR